MMKALDDLKEALDKATEYSKYALDHLADAEYEGVMTDIRYALDHIHKAKAWHASIVNNVDSAIASLKSTF